MHVFSCLCAPSLCHECLCVLRARGKVIAYQRRLNYIKNEFFARGCATPLGELVDWWATSLVVLLNMYSSLLCLSGVMHVVYFMRAATLTH